MYIIRLVRTCQYVGHLIKSDQHTTQQLKNPALPLQSTRKLRHERLSTPVIKEKTWQVGCNKWLVLDDKWTIKKYFLDRSWTFFMDDGCCLGDYNMVNGLYEKTVANLKAWTIVLALAPPWQSIHQHYWLLTKCGWLVNRQNLHANEMRSLGNLLMTSYVFWGIVNPTFNKPQSLWIIGYRSLGATSWINQPRSTKVFPPSLDMLMLLFECPLAIKHGNGKSLKWRLLAGELNEKFSSKPSLTLRRNFTIFNYTSTFHDSNLHFV